MSLCAGDALTQASWRLTLRLAPPDNSSRNSQSRCKSYAPWLCRGEGRSQLPVSTDPLWGLSSLSHHGLKTLFHYQMQTWWPRLSTAGQINTEPQELLTIFSGKTREPSIELWLQKLDTYCRRRRRVRERVMVLWRYWHMLFALE